MRVLINAVLAVVLFWIAIPTALFCVGVWDMWKQGYFH